MWWIITIIFGVLAAIVIGAIVAGRCYALSRRIYQGTESMSGKTVIITGGNCGIGKTTAEGLVRRGAKVILACRNMVAAKEAVDDIRRNTEHGILLVKKLDLSSFKSVREFCEDINKTEDKVDVLINNAGILGGEIFTEDGLEIVLQVNHLSHFLMTDLLLDKIKKSTPSRIVVISSSAHRGGKIDFQLLNKTKTGIMEQYANTKLANALFSRELAKKLEGDGVNVYCVHPGVIKTEIGRDLRARIPWFIRIFTDILTNSVILTPAEGAQTSLYCAVSDEVANDTGYYYSNCGREEYSTDAMDNGLAKKLWDYSEKLVGLS